MQDQIKPAPWYGIALNYSSTLNTVNGKPAKFRCGCIGAAQVPLVYDHDLSKRTGMNVTVYECEGSPVAFAVIEPPDYQTATLLNHMSLSIGGTVDLSENNQNGETEVLRFKLDEVTLTNRPADDSCILINSELFDVNKATSYQLQAYSAILEFLNKPRLKQYENRLPVLREGSLADALTANRVSGVSIYRNGSTPADGFVLTFDDLSFKPLCSLNISEDIAGSLAAALLDVINV